MHVTTPPVGRHFDRNRVDSRHLSERLKDAVGPEGDMRSDFQDAPRPAMSCYPASSVLKLSASLSLSKL